MMRLSPGMVILLAALSSAPFVAWRLREAASAHESAQEATRQLRALESQAAQILELRAAAAHVESAQRPPQDVIALVHRALADAGVPSDRFASLERESDGPAAASGTLRRQSLVLALERMEPAEICAFLDRWRRHAPAWGVSRLELSHGRESGATAPPPSRYAVRLVLEACYRSDGFTHK